jgi:hypothetical protein
LALLIWPIAFCFYTATIIFHALRLKLVVGRWRLVRTIILVIAQLFGVTFTLTVGVAPETVDSTITHIYGFSFGMLGYSALKLYGLVEYFAYHPGTRWSNMDWHHRVYMSMEFVSFCCFFVTSIYLYICIQVIDWEAAAALPTPQDVPQDWLGAIFVITPAALGPLVCYYTAPTQRRLAIKGH